MRDLYSDLGVRRDAGPKALNNAMEWVRANRTEMSESYRRAVQAYSVLSDPELRKEYDLEVSRQDRDALLHLLGGGPADLADVTVYLDPPRAPRHRLVDSVEHEQAGWRGLIGRRH